MFPIEISGVGSNCSNARGSFRIACFADIEAQQTDIPMKTGLHPQVYDTRVTCSCGNSFNTRATVESLQLDICSNCHPFFTGTQKLVDTQGQVERFQQRLKKAGRRNPAPTPATPEDSGSIAESVNETDD